MRSRTASGSNAETRPAYVTSQRATMRRTPRNLLSVSDRSSSAAFDARAADDRLVPVVEPHPGLAVAVVVRRPDEQRRVAASDAHPLASLRLATAPNADEWVLPALAPDRRLVRVAGQDAHRVGQVEQNVHHGAAHGLDVSAADGLAE